MATHVSWLDFKLGARMLAKYPGLTAVGGVALAFAIGTGAVTFELVTQAFYPTLPLPGREDIVALRVWDMAASSAGERVMEEQALYDFAMWRDELESVDDLGAFRTVERNLSVGPEPGEPVEVAEMTASGFDVARTAPFLGRPLVAADEQPGAPSVVVIGYGEWRTRFGADRDIVGREIRLGSTPHTIVGVMPPGFSFPVSHGFWVPLRLNPLDHAAREGPGIAVFGRLTPDVSLADARAELTALGRRMSAAFPETHEHLRPQIVPYATSSIDPADRTVGYLSNVFVLLFLVLVCANVATLVFARTATRENELAVRGALGASRGRVVTQLFIEALVLGAIAALIGLAAGAWVLRWGWGAIGEAASDIPFWFHAGLSPRTLLYTGVLTLLVAAIAGVVPGLNATGRGMEARLKESAARGSSVRFGRLWVGVIVAQVTVTVAFLPFLIRLARDTVSIAHPDFGFPAQEYLSFRLELDRETPTGASPEATEGEFRTRLETISEELERRLSAEPGVAEVTFATHLPGGQHPWRRIELDGAALPAGSVLSPRVQTAAVDVGFFDALGARIIAGRGFHSGDLESGARTAIVNESFVDRFLAGRNPIGRRVRYLSPNRPSEHRDDEASVKEEPRPWLEIVGVAEELKLTIDPDLPHNAGVYRPVTAREARPMRIAVHVRGEPAAFAPRARAIAAGVDRSLRLSDIRPLEEIQWARLGEYGLYLRLGVLAGAVVLLLSTVGIYAIMSFTVARRTREIGIRVALGADRRRIIASIFSRALVQLGAGVVAGAGLFMLLEDGMSASLSEVVLIGLGIAIVVVVGIVACVVPVQRALSIEPTEALRADA